MPTRDVLVADFGNLSGDNGWRRAGQDEPVAVLDDAILDAFAAAGVFAIILGCQYPDYPFPPGNAHLNLAAIDAHPVVEAWAYFENAPLARVLDHIGYPRLAAMRFRALAVEPRGGAETEPSIRQALNEIDSVRTVAGHASRTVLYGNAQAAADLGLHAAAFPDRDGWVADYDEVAELDALPVLGIGHVIGKQFTGSASIPGVPFPVDLSIWRLDVLELRKTVNADEVDAIVDTAAAAVDSPDNLTWIARADGGGLLVLDVPEGCEVIVAQRHKDE